jgi:hypothetical protein
VSDIFQSLADAIPSHLRKEVERELINGWQLNEVKDKIEVKRLGEFHKNNVAKPIDGIGELRASIPPSAFHYWGTRLGYECWEDRQFLREFIRDNPETAVRNRMKRTMVRGAVFTADGYLT